CRKTRDVAARSREARDKSAADRIGDHGENDRNSARLLQKRRCSRCGVRKNEIGPQRDKFFRELSHQVRVAGCGPAGVKLNVPALHPAELAETVTECRNVALSLRVALGIAHQHTNSPHPVGLLPTRRERPGRRAAEERDEIAPFHQQFFPCFEAEDSTAGDLLHCGISGASMSAMGQTRAGQARAMSASLRKQTNTPTSRYVRFVPKAT